MRAPFLISTSAHAAILLATIIGLPSVDPFEIEEPTPIPVEILTVDEFTRLTSKPREPEPEAKVEPQPEPKTEPPPEPKPERQVEPQPAPPPAPEPEPEPQQVAKLEQNVEPLPLPEPLLREEPEPEPAPEPPLVETPPDSEPKPEVEEAKPEPEPAEPPVATPRRKPKPPPAAQVARKAQEQKPRFDADRISALLNKLPDDQASAPRPSGAETTEPVRDLGGLEASLTMSEIAYLRQQVERCWNPPVGIAGAEQLAVKIELGLRRDGTLATDPVVVNSGGAGFQIAAEAALRAVTLCQPYELPGEKYDAWREIIFTFDPRFMLGG